MDTEITMPNYTAILLAAGVGSRISSLVKTPKCLLKVNGKTLLEHHLDNWKKCGIKNVRFVLGYMAEDIEAVVNQYKDDFKITYIFNEEYRTKGNTHSLYLGVKDLNTPSLIFDADLIYETNILKNFLEDTTADQVLTGSGNIQDIECAKVLVDQKGMVRKTVDKRAISEEELKEFKFLGEAIGILKFSKDLTHIICKEAEDFLSKKENIMLNWEHLMNEVFQNNSVYPSFFNEGKWIEIDTPEDFNNAQRIFS